MKKSVLLGIGMIFSLVGQGQSLNAGDLAIIGYHSEGKEGFTFLTLDTIPGDEVVYFTNRGWVDGAWTEDGNNETHVRWTSPSEGVPCGTVIRVREIRGNVFATTYRGKVDFVDQGLSGGFNLKHLGDQLLAYQSSTPPVSGSPGPPNPTFITALNWNYNASYYDAATGWADGAPGNDVNESEVPAGLTNGVNCLSLANPTTQVGTQLQNAALNKGLLIGSNGSVIAAIHDINNWFLDGSPRDVDLEFFDFDPQMDCTPGTTWDGSTSSDWSDNTNWNNDRAPSLLVDARIPSGTPNDPHVTADPASPATASNLRIESGASVTIDAGKALTLSGFAKNDGTFLIKADGTGIGSFIDNGIDPDSDGSFQMEQYVTGAGGATPNGRYWYVSSPVSGATSAVYDAAGSNRLWWADETDTWYPEITDNTTSLNKAQGYITRTGATSIVTFSGDTFYTGDVSVPNLTRSTTLALDPNTGYNLVGNPYPSTLSFDDAVKTDLQPSMWFRLFTPSGIMWFDTYNSSNGLGTNNNGDGAINGDIPPTQAFWIRVADGASTGELSFTNAMRSHGTRARIFREEEETNTIRINVSDGNVSDEGILTFNEDASDLFDEHDSQKFWNSLNYAQLYMTVGVDTLTINGMSSVATNPVVDLGVKIPGEGEYTLNATSITVDETVYLEDRLLNRFYSLTNDPTYAFTSVAGNFPNRFALHFGAALTTGIEGEELENTQAFIYASDRTVQVLLDEEATVDGKVSVIDLSGQLVNEQPINATRTQLNLGEAASGIYLVRVATSDQTVTRKISIH